MRGLADPDRSERTLLVVLGITLLSLAVRLFDLGGRVFHWDEGRVGYWTLRYIETGFFEYSPIIHGPFLPITNGYILSILPATDANARLIVAIVGGLLPLSAWLFRERLRDTEVIALSVLLASTPILLYYSRFMRNDMLVGGFAFLAFAFAVRAIDTHDIRKLYPAAFFLALSFTTKGNAILYVACFGGALFLALDHKLVRESRQNGSLKTTLRNWITAARSELAKRSGRIHTALWIPLHTLGLAGTFLAVIVFYYTPRPEFHTALREPSQWGWMLHVSTIGAAEKLYDLWFDSGLQGHDYLPYLFDLTETLVYGAGILIVFAVLGFIADGYARADLDTETGSRAIVAFTFYWAVASVIGYPAATDIRAGWTATHVVLPLSIPAAVGLAYTYRVVRNTWQTRTESATPVTASAQSHVTDGGTDTTETDTDGGETETEHKSETGTEQHATPSQERRILGLEPSHALTLTLVSLLLLGAVIGLAAPNAAYWNSTNPDHTEMVQWAQPHNDVKPTLEDVDRVIRHTDTGDSADVLFVGTANPNNADDVTLYLENESTAETKPVGGPAWHSRLPFPWYIERAGGHTESVPPEATADEFVDDAPPVIIARDWDRSCDDEGDRCLDAAFSDDYVAYEHEARLWAYELVFYIDEEALADARAADGLSDRRE